MRHRITFKDTYFDEPEEEDFSDDLDELEESSRDIDSDEYDYDEFQSDLKYNQDWD